VSTDICIKIDFVIFKHVILALDSTMRTYTADGRLHIARSHITKAAVNKYYGREIPGWEALGLVRDQAYFLLRDPDELTRAAETFRMLPILNKHMFVTDFDGLDEQEKKKYIVGSTGSDIEFLDPYLDADTSIWDINAITGIETDRVREFSCSYRYVPIMASGDYKGVHYDGIMTQIQGNHLALVESGRAGNDVLAADQSPESTQMKRSKLGNALIVAATTAFPAVKVAMDGSELEKLLASAKRKTFIPSERKKAAGMIVAMDSAIDEKQVIAVFDAMTDVEEEEKKPAEDADDHPKGCVCEDCKGARDSDEDYDDEDDKEKRKGARDKAAKDRKAKDEKPSKAAMDAAIAGVRADFIALDEARRDVRSVVGEIVVAMDSAEAVYSFALDHLGVEHKDAEGVKAKRAIFKVAAKQSAPAAPRVAMDSAPAMKRFKDLGRIRVM
jgi:uncharacterized protein